MSVDFKGKTISAIRWTSLSSGFTALTYVIQLVVLTKLLSKFDFGLVSLAMVVLGFAQAFIDMGFSNAIIHKQDSTKSQLNSLFWLNVLSGVFLFTIIFSISGLIADFYGEEQLKSILHLCSLNFLIQPFGIQFKVILQKELKLKFISIVEIFGNILFIISSIIIAIISPSAYSIVIGFLVNSFFTSLVFFMKGVKGSPISFGINFTEIKEFISFGVFQMLERIINYFNTQVDVLIIGKILGPEVLGVYSVAKQIILRPAQLINPIITKVSFPLMAKFQNDLPKLKEIYLKVINHLSSINFVIYSLIFILSEDIIRVFIGEKWISASIILKILSLFGALRSTINPIGSLLLARGFAKRSFYWNLFVFIVYPASIYLGSQWGIEGVCFAQVILIGFLLIPNWFFQVRHSCGARFFEYHFQILRPFTLNIILLLPFFVFLKFDISALWNLALVVTAYSFSIFILYWKLNKSFLLYCFDFIGIKINK